MNHHSAFPPSGLSRRAALAGLSAGGVGLALGATGRPAAGQDAGTATHPIVGLWQYDSGWPPQPGDPDWAFQIFHADGTFTTWGGLNIGTALGIWRSTGERTGELIIIWRDTDPNLGGAEGPGTATFHFDLEVDAADTTLTFSNGTIDVRDPYGTHLFPPGSFGGGVSDIRPVTRVTFDRNPMTGSTVTAPATPTAATPST